MEIDEKELDALYRTSLSVFVERVFAHLNPETSFESNWHLELIASRLEAVLEGRVKRLIINVPPRSLKSILTSVAFVAWALGLKPSLRVICASYGQDLADKHAQDCCNVMTSHWYQRVFPTRLKGSRPAVADLKTTQGGGRFATSVGGVLTGLGGDLIVIDDPLKPDEALSDSARNAANAWIDNTVMSRFNDKRTGALILIMQRLHLDDVVGHVQAHGEWEVLSLPAIAEAEQTYEFETIFGPRKVKRRIGDLLHPTREPIEVLNGLRATLGEYNFAGQYQQAPAPLGGGLIRRDWILSYEQGDLPKFEQIVQSWDTASKESELADYSVCTTWGVKGTKRYLLHVLRERMEFPQLKRAVVDQIERFAPGTVLIEDKASGIQLIQELRAVGHSIIKAIKPEGNKVMRLNAQTPAFEGGFVLLPWQAAWLESYVLELTTFPRGKYDDQVDSTSQALAWISINGIEPGIIAYTRMLAEQAQSRM